ncbi:MULTISPECIES: type II secretion system F family protein [unclassified Legionella]|uniref:type II secretion system F family protein n=1 Tax=unclassified Legionella TaxID=2622702 RepID=UPI001E38E938|nr:type II secretion system F family protein [Legionella sp. 31fI33]MCC5015942.1 type II secretion system F family protein [Legionella sp. 31fI33]
MTNKTNYYQWQGLNRRGEKLTGSLAAPNLAAVRIELRKQGVITKKISKLSFFSSLRINKKITTNDITLFSRQMATLIKAGIPLIQSFETLIKSCSNQAMKNLLQIIKKDIETGLTLTESFRKHPPFFNTLFCNLVDAGEKSGSLELTLTKLAVYKEKMGVIKRGIKKILAYPCAVLSIALFVTVALLIYVIPQFEQLFKTFDAELPLLTRGIIYFSQFFKNYWLISTGTVLGIIYSLFYAFKRSQQFRQWLDKLLLKTPFLGVVLTKIIIARFAWTLSITFAAGLPLLEALKLVAQVTGNSIYTQAVNDVQKEIGNGQQLQTALASKALFPAMVIQMIAVGEESGTLELMLTRIATYYEEEVDSAISTLNNLLEPIIMSLLGLLIGILIIALYLPIFKLGSIV